jgi:hypothetical protein
MLLVIGLSLVWGLVSVWDHFFGKLLEQVFDLDTETLAGSGIYAAIFTMLALFLIHLLGIDYTKFF